MRTEIATECADFLLCLLQQVLLTLGPRNPVFVCWEMADAAVRELQAFVDSVTESISSHKFTSTSESHTPPPACLDLGTIDSAYLGQIPMMLSNTPFPKPACNQLWGQSPENCHFGNRNRNLDVNDEKSEPSERELEFNHVARASENARKKRKCSATYPDLTVMSTLCAEEGIVPDESGTCDPVLKKVSDLVNILPDEADETIVTTATKLCVWKSEVLSVSPCGDEDDGGEIDADQSDASKNSLVENRPICLDSSARALRLSDGSLAVAEDDAGVNPDDEEKQFVRPGEAELLQMSTYISSEDDASPDFESQRLDNVDVQRRNPDLWRKLCIYCFSLICLGVILMRFSILDVVMEKWLLHDMERIMLEDGDV